MKVRFPIPFRTLSFCSPLVNKINMLKVFSVVGDIQICKSIGMWQKYECPIAQELPCFTMISGTVLPYPCLPLARHLTTPSCDIGRLDQLLTPRLATPSTTELAGSSFVLFATREKSCESANSISGVWGSNETACGQIGTPPAGRPLRWIRWG